MQTVDATEARKKKLWESGALYRRTFLGRRKIVGIDHNLWAQDESGRSWSFHGATLLLYDPIS